MMIVKDTPERVVWLDFDRAHTYDEDRITVEEDLIKEEEIIIMDIQDAIATDANKGKLDEAYLFYCT
ncbi:unnamed protein product [Penicillium glandicola]